jgi:GTPase SAR1 family protein
MVFSLTDQSSLINVRDFYYVNIKNKLPCPVILVGNKIDLSEKREIERENGEQLAKHLNIDDYIETSASMPPINVDETFHKIVHKLITDHPKIKSNKKTAFSNHHRTNCYGLKKCSVM